MGTGGGVWSNVKNLDSVIERFSQNWRVDRLGKIELTCSVSPFRNAVPADVPPKVSINEALELSTRFGDAKAKSFINGILDAAIKLRKPVRSQLRARPTPDRLAGFDAKRAGVDPAPDYTAIRISHEQA